MGALRLYQLKGDGEWLSAANRIKAWTANHLQDADGLYLDNIRVGGEQEGEIDRRKFTYNTALMIRANVLSYEITGEACWLAEAQRLARAAEAHWIDPATGTIRDGGRFAHLLVDALLALHAADGDPHWLEISQRSLGYLHEHLRDDAGKYSGRWDRPADRRRGMELLDQASVARAFLAVAGALRDTSRSAKPPE